MFHSIFPSLWSPAAWSFRHSLIAITLQQSVTVMGYRILNMDSFLCISNNFYIMMDSQNGMSILEPPLASMLMVSTFPIYNSMHISYIFARTLPNESECISKTCYRTPKLLTFHIGYKLMAHPVQTLCVCVRAYFCDLCHVCMSKCVWMRSVYNNVTCKFVFVCELCGC